MATIGEVRSDEAAWAYNENTPDGLRALVERTGEWLELLTGEPGAVNAAMNQLAHSIRDNVDPYADRPWRDHWMDGDLDPTMRRGQQLTSLMFYGPFGVNPDVPGTPTIKAIAERVNDFRVFVDAVPAGWCDMGELEKITLTAEARVALDAHESVTPEQLAAIGGIGFRSLQNLLAKKGENGLRAGADGRISADVALEWLSARETFRSSVWMDPDRPADAPEFDADDEYLFVPVASDNSAFTPECRRDKGYQVGLKGEEKMVEDYREALEQIARMPRPAWRRPNDNGNWGIVRADRWERRSAASLGLRPRM